MANTQTQLGTTLITDIPMTGSDVTFTFNAKTWKALIQCDADTTKIYAHASASSGAGAFTIPTVNKGPALEFVEIAGRTYTFNGTNATNVQIIEYLGAST